MAGDAGGEDEGSPSQGGYVGRAEFMLSIGRIMDMLKQLAQRGECETPPPQVPDHALREGVEPARIGEDAPGRRPGKEVAAEGSRREVEGRELFPSPASAVAPAGLVARVDLARPPARGSPFCELVLSAPVPEGFREPETTYYAGKDDPLQHLQWFEDAVSIRPMTDAFKCRLFAITLKDKARDWFHQLPAGSIYCFEDLSRSFQLRFSTSKKRKKNPESIFLIKQKTDESLAQYVDRFQEEILDIQEVPGFALQMAFTVGLREGFFKMSLTRKAPLSFEGLMEKAAKEIAMEAANPAFARKLVRLTEGEQRESGGTRQQEGRRREEPRGPVHPELGWRQPGGPVQGPGRGPPQGGRNFYPGPGRFHPLGWGHGPRPLPPPAQQAMAIGRGRGRGRERGRAIGGRRRNPQDGRCGGGVLPYCDFHEEEGHATATCPEFLELRRGRGGEDQRPPVQIVEMPGAAEEDRCVDRSDTGDRGGIGVIHGVVGIEATRKASLHTMYRRSVASTSQAPPPDEKITFSRRDLPDHEDPFCDALVIQTAIENFTVSRILVDNGSSVNVIFKKAFNEMRVEARRVLAADGPLFGFSGERKEVEGGVGLQVTLGGLSRNCRFVIVDAPSSYNAIFGRPLISAFRCVPSSFHQCLKLNSGGTQIRVRGDPKATRECYVTAVNTISWKGDAEELEKKMAGGEELEKEGGGERGIAVEPTIAGEQVAGGEELVREEARVGESLVAEVEMAGGEELEKEGGGERGIVVEPAMAGEQVAGGEELVREEARVGESLVAEVEMAEGEELEREEGGGDSGIAVEPAMAGKQVAREREHRGNEGSIDEKKRKRASPEGDLGREKGRAQERVAVVEGRGVEYGAKDLEEDLRDPEEEEPSRLRAAVEVLEVEILTKDGRREKIKISGELTPKDQEEIRRCVKESIDVFAWSAADMPGIDADVACHRLNLDPKVRPIQQKKRAIAFKMARPIREEVEKLLQAGFISANRYPGWVSNIVMVKKGKGKWRMCIDFSLLNKACPKDCYPLPRIDALVDSAVGFSLMSFLDAFSGYHQIRMHPPDVKDVTFVTEDGCFSYNMMPFRLKNAGATYQRMMDQIFREQKGRNLEVYADDLMVKSRDLGSHVLDLQETFATVRKYKMRLNPLKCVFGASTGKFLGHLLTPAGVEPNPDKVKAILELKSPRNAKEVQRLTGKLAGLSRFLSKAGERCSSFFRTLRGGREFEWTLECEKAFEALKQQLTQTPLLQGPREGESLFLYLGVGTGAVSSVLVREEGKKQFPIYYVSRVLKKAELKYPILEKLAFALIMSARKLRPYFQAHAIQVVTDHPLRRILEGVEHSGRLTKWSIELSEFDLSYIPREAIKAQVVADFLADYVVEAGEVEVSPVAAWDMLVDGASGKNSFGGGVILTSPEGTRIEQALKIRFTLTNNHAEYEAIIAGLRLARDLGIQDIRVFTDSLVVARHINGEFEVREPTLQLYLVKIKGIVGQFHSFSVQHVPREESARADSLAKHGPQAGGTMTELFRPSIEEGEIMEVDQEVSWMDPFVTFLATGRLPEGDLERKRIRYKSAYYLLKEGVLYRKTLSGLLARCVSEKETSKVLEEVHSGECGSHSGSRTLEGRTFGFPWFITLESTEGELGGTTPSVLWALRTTPNTATGETPFKLSHGSEAVIPVEFEVESPRVTTAKEGDERWQVDNGEEQRLSLDLVEELRELASIRQEEAKRRMSRYFDKHIRVKQFQKGDLVLKKVDVAGRGASVGKLNPNWEGPFIVKEALKSGGYHLQDVDGVPLDRARSGDDLKRFYP
ncbi:hypothetical protein KSP39_PZI002328 [Platanthera zijinensis]|uniref:RNase H type-1 domain-containing protein n=1 Tax=Platanthera zijinensis TaxID=2320716 RepID=A0AAP0GE24_9ASPA